MAMDSWGIKQLSRKSGRRKRDKRGENVVIGF